MSRLSIVILLVSATAAAQPAPDSASSPPAESPTASPPASPPEAPPPAPSPEAPPPASPPEAPRPAPSPEAPPSAPPPAAPPAAAEAKQASPLEVKPGGYLQVDSRAFATDTGTHELTVRRLRFKATGSAFGYFKFNTLVETAASQLQIQNAWIEFAPRRELALRFGKDKAQFGIERLQSATDLTFIERAYPTQLSPNRDIGLALRGDLFRGVVHYSAAVVDGVADNAVLEAETDDELEYDVHLLISPLAANAQLSAYGDLAIGGAATFGRTHGTLANPGLTAIKSDGQARIFRYAGGGAMPTLDTTAIADGYRHRLAAHAYYYGGPVGALAEYVADYEPVLLEGTHTLLRQQAWQLAASLALTPGDRPSYKSIVPKRPFDPKAGTWGAVEVAVRYSELRIDDAAFDHDIASSDTSVRRARAGTLGVNWYFNRYFKLQVNYTATGFDGGAPDGDRPTEHLIATRAQAAI